MPQSICSGAMLQCTFGLAPSSLNVLPDRRVLSKAPLATIMDYKPLVHIMPFGMCNSLSNPTVAAATSAALGVLTPMPCVPNTATPWAPGSPQVLIGGEPALHNGCKLMCMWGGVISITMAAPNQVQL